MDAPAPHPDRTRRAPDLAFGGFRFDPSAEELYRGDARVELQPKPAAVLAMLLEQPGRLVSREQIRLRVWGDTFLDHEQRIHSAIRDVRKALGDDPALPRFIETVPKKGYRFVAAVDLAASDARSWFGRSLPWVAAGLVLLAIARFGPRPGEPPTDPSNPALLLVRPVRAIGDDPEHLAEGLWEELLVATARAAPGSLAVVGRATALKLEAEADNFDGRLREIGVSHVLETTVRRNGARVRVSATLARPSEPAQIWSSPYDRDLGDLLTVQADIAGRIAAALELEMVTPTQPAVASRPIAPAAASAYLSGRHALAIGSPETLRRAVGFFEHATAADPEFAPGFVGLARALYDLDAERERARAAVETALGLDPDSAEARFVAARMSLYWDWDAEAAADSYRRAIRLDPGNGEFRLGHAELLTATGATDLALQEAETARTLDPLSGGVHGRLGWMFLRARQPARAVTECRRALAVSPESFYEDLISHDCLVLGYLSLGEPEQAAGFAHGVMRLFGQMPPADETSTRGAASSSADLAAYWRWRIEQMRRFPGTEIDLAISHVALGETGPAIAALQAALDARSGALVFLGVDPAFDALRGLPEFDSIERAVGLGRSLGPAR